MSSSGKDTEEPAGIQLRTFRSLSVVGASNSRAESQAVQREAEATGTMADNKKWACFVLFLVTVGAIMTVILTPMCFSDLDYYEMGFLRRKSTGNVDRSKVYFAGRHYTGIDYTFKKFRADAHLVTFSNFEVFTANTLEVTIAGSLQYFINKDELKNLHDQFDIGYKDIVKNTAYTAIKNAAINFTSDQYLRNRPLVSAALFKAVRIALNGICCPKDCIKYLCEPGCKPYSTCTTKDKGVFCVAKYFQLDSLGMKEEQRKLFLQNAIEAEKLAKENYKKQEKIERKKTQQERQIIENKALEVSQNSSAVASKLRNIATSNAAAITENARKSGLQIIYSTLNITNEAHKKSLDYICTLRNHNNVRLYVGYKTLVAKEGP